MAIPTQGSPVKKLVKVLVWCGVLVAIPVLGKRLIAWRDRTWAERSANQTELRNRIQAPAHAALDSALGIRSAPPSQPEGTQATNIVEGVKEADEPGVLAWAKARLDALLGRAKHQVREHTDPAGVRLSDSLGLQTGERAFLPNGQVVEGVTKGR